MPVYKFTLPLAAATSGNAITVVDGSGVTVDTITIGQSAGAVSTVETVGSTLVVTSNLDLGSYRAEALHDEAWLGVQYSAEGVLDVPASLQALPDTYAPVSATRLGVYQGRPSINDTPVTMTSPPTVVITGPSNVPPITGTYLDRNTTMLTRREGRYADQLVNTVTYQNNYVNNPSTSRSEGAVEFTFSGAEFALKFYNAIAGSSGVRIWVDGQLAGQWLTAGGSTIQNPYWATVTFTASSVRRIRVEIKAGAIFGGINFAATAAVTPMPDRLPRCAVFGDSFIGGALSVLHHDLYYYQLGRELGWETARLGHGGSGYAVDGTGAGVEYENAARVAELALFAPEFAVIFGSINNDATAEATVEAAALSLYSQIATASPQTRVFVVGPPPLATAVPAGRLTARDALARASEASPNVVQFIDPIAGAWITDANAATYIGSDATHPNEAGHKYLARKTALEILRVV